MVSEERKRERVGVVIGFELRKMIDKKENRKRGRTRSSSNLQTGAAFFTKGRIRGNSAATSVANSGRDIVGV